MQQFIKRKLQCPRAKVKAEELRLRDLEAEMNRFAPNPTAQAPSTQFFGLNIENETMRVTEEALESKFCCGEHWARQATTRSGILVLCALFLFLEVATGLGIQGKDFDRWPNLVALLLALALKARPTWRDNYFVWLVPYILTTIMYILLLFPSCEFAQSGSSFEVLGIDQDESFERVAFFIKWPLLSIILMLCFHSVGLRRHTLLINGGIQVSIMSVIIPLLLSEYFPHEKEGLALVTLAYISAAVLTLFVVDSSFRVQKQEYKERELASQDHMNYMVQQQQSAEQRQAMMRCIFQGMCKPICSIREGSATAEKNLLAASDPTTHTPCPVSKCLNNITRTSHALSRMLFAAHSLSKLQTRSFVFEDGAFDLHAWFEETTGSFCQEMEKACHRMTTRCADSIKGLAVYGDRGRLQQALRALVMSTVERVVDRESGELCISLEPTATPLSTSHSIGLTLTVSHPGVRELCDKMNLFRPWAVPEDGASGTAGMGLDSCSSNPLAPRPSDQYGIAAQLPEGQCGSLCDESALSLGTEHVQYLELAVAKGLIENNPAHTGKLFCLIDGEMIANSNSSPTQHSPSTSHRFTPETPATNGFLSSILRRFQRSISEEAVANPRPDFPPLPVDVEMGESAIWPRSQSPPPAANTLPGQEQSRPGSGFVVELVLPIAAPRAAHERAQSTDGASSSTSATQ